VSSTRFFGAFLAAQTHSLPQYFLLEPLKISPLTFVEQSRPEFISETKGRGNAECYLAPSHAPRMRAIQYPQASRIEDQRLWNTGSPDQVGRRHRWWVASSLTLSQ
jgi:hypothetical protein